MTDDVLVAIETVLSVVEEENARLAAGDIPAATALLPKKEAALAGLSRLTPTCERADGPGDACCTVDVSDAVTRLNATLDRNKELLQQAMTIQNYVVRLLSDAALATPHSAHYGQSGSYMTNSRVSARAFTSNA
ncbi:hypothetical protein [Acetobacter sp. DsW_063]|uniref:hypothetical protein n=1 Tax=Acetobacter sp. DsW_063 TaxID=1514894 RepID=UPI000A3733F4|nr:hypothetical protein [Acetobacter sp. DsW_063]